MSRGKTITPGYLSGARPRHRLPERLAGSRRQPSHAGPLGRLTRDEGRNSGRPLSHLNEAPNYGFALQNFARFSLHVLDYPRNMTALQQICELLSNLPRRPKLLLTVSPVPFMSTFSDKDVVIANTYSKATLRAVVEDFAAQDAATDYVPVFEAVVNSRVDLAWERDRIHVADVAVRANVFHFLAHYLADPVKSSQAASALSTLLGGNQIGGQRNRNVPFPDFEFADLDTHAFPAGFPEIAVSSEMALNYGARFLGSGPPVPWHAKRPARYPQIISVSFRAALTAKALWLQAQDRHFDRAPCTFSVYGYTAITIGICCSNRATSRPGIPPDGRRGAFMRRMPSRGSRLSSKKIVATRSY
jgi:hypothetical protein